jgi:oligosaccharide repeat unit polymerase
MPVQLSPRKVFLLYLVLFGIGYLNMLVAVGFDPAELVDQMLRPRFTQPWQRGQVGGWAELVGELGGLLLQLVPAIAGSVLADRSRYSRLQIAVVVLGLAFTLFYGFSGGTRNVFAVYVILFVGSYVIFKSGIGWRYAVFLGCVTAGVLYLSAYYMLQFRRVGLAAYMQGWGDAQGHLKETLFIDHNLPVISRLTDLFPDSVQYLGLEVVYYSIVRPVPRALWPDKPMGLSVEVADVLGLHGLTISSTFVGEAYMMGGYLAIVVVGLVLGWLAGWWNRFGQDLRSNVNVALYASGFFAAMISMRSMLWLTTAMLPSFALWLYLKSRQRKLQRRGTRSVSQGASV